MLAADIAGRLDRLQIEHLPRVIPFVDRRVGVEPFVALQANQRRIENRREHLGDLGLADARLAFEQQRLAHLEHEVKRGRQRTVGDVLLLPQCGLERIDRVERSTGVGMQMWRGDSAQRSITLIGNAESLARIASDLPEIISQLRGECHEASIHRTSTNRCAVPASSVARG